jgi:cytochrome c
MAYTDKGGKEIGPLTSRKIVTLRYPRLQAETYDLGNNIARQGTRENTGFITRVKDGAYIAFENIDLTGISKLTFALNTRQAGSTIDIRLDSVSGKQIGTATLVDTSTGRQWKELTTNINKTQGLHTLYFVFTNKTEKSRDLLDLDWIYFHADDQAMPATHSRAGSKP